MTRDERTWPTIPPELAHAPLTFPYLFRSLVAGDKQLSNEEVGRIVRSIALNTDFFETPEIAARVQFLRDYMAKRDRDRERLRRFRAKHNPTGKSKAKIEPAPPVDISNDDSVTVLDVDEEGLVTDTIVSLPKTPTITEEKTPPIVPLEESTASFLESGRQKTTANSRKNRIVEKVQQDLFSLVQERPKEELESDVPKTRQEGTQVLSEVSDGKTHCQDIEKDPEAVKDAFDARVDAAWIPMRFAVFWKNYPRRIAKASAIKAFTKLIKSQKDIETFMKTLLSSIEWWKQQDSWQKDGGKYIPYPATWLNGGHWEDAAENNDVIVQSQGEFIDKNQESDEELMRRMQGGL